MKVGGKDEGNFAVTGLSFDFGNHSHGSNLFPSSNGFSFQPREVDHSLDIKPATVAQNGFSSNLLSKIEQNGTVNGSDSDHVVGTFGPDERFGDFESASTETGLNQEVSYSLFQPFRLLNPLSLVFSLFHLPHLFSLCL